jgi:RND family efflux transporter MFP subunit
MNRQTIRVLGAALLVVVCVVGVVSCAKRRGRGAAKAPPAAATAVPPATPVSVVTAMRGGIKDAIVATGTVAAIHEVNVMPEGAGRVTTVTADLGDRVSRGSLLVRLDIDLISAQVRQADANIAAARARLTQARDTVDLTDSTNTISVQQARKQVEQAQTQVAKAQTGAQTTETAVNNQIAQARLGVQSAQTQLADIRRGARDQQRRQAVAQVDAAQADYDFAKNQYEVKKRLYTQGAASGTEFGSAMSQYQASRAQLELARQAQSLTAEGATGEQIRLAELQVDRAQEQLHLAEAQRDQIALAHQDVELAQRQVRLAQDQVDLARAGKGEVKIRRGDVEAAAAGVKLAAASRDLASTTLSKSSVYAPISGLVSARLTEPGEYANPAMPVFRLVDISRVYVNAVLSEADITRVSRGQQAAITLKGTAGARFVGQVVDITPSAIPNQRNFIVRILVDNQGQVLRPGMSANVRITVGENSSAILVPRDCVVEDRQERLVYAVVNGKIEVRKVRLGAEEAGRVEIAQGVKEGDLLVAAGQTNLANGQVVKPIQRSVK